MKAALTNIALAILGVALLVAIGLVCAELAVFSPGGFQ